MKSLFRKLIYSRTNTQRSPVPATGTLSLAKAVPLSSSGGGRFRPPLLMDPPAPGRGALGRSRPGPRLQYGD